MPQLQVSVQLLPIARSSRTGNSALQQAEAEGQFAAFIAAAKELRALFEAIGRSTGELAPPPPLVEINIQASEEWTAIRSIVFGVLEDRPDIQQRLSERLRVLEPGFRTEN